MEKLSVIVCTYNRCISLRDTLYALDKQAVPGDVELEILVVDNNSFDNTEQVFDEVAEQSDKAFHYLFVGKQGKCFALNEGIKESEGDYLLLTDDDVLPEPDWIASIWEAFKTYDADCVGGPVRPIWTRKPPRWLRTKERQYALFALLDRGTEPIVSEELDPNFLLGANIAYKKAVFEKVGFFRTDLGPKGKSLGRGDDTEMLKRVMKSGGKVVYFPKAEVRHKVSTERMEMKYLRKWRYEAGKTFARIPKKDPTVGYPWHVKKCLQSGAMVLLRYIQRSQELSVAAEEEFWTRLGIVMELREQKRERKEAYSQ